MSSVVKKLFKFGSIYVTANVINRAIPILLMPILTRLLTESEYGQVTLFTSFVILLLPIMGVNSNTIIGQLYFKTDESERKGLVNDAFKLVFFSSVAVVALIIVLSPLIMRWFDFPVWLQYSALAVAFMNMNYTNIKTIFQMEKKAFLYAGAEITLTVINISASILFVLVLGFGLQGRILGISVASIAGFIFTLFYALSKGLIRIKKRAAGRSYIKKMFKLGAVLIPTSIGGWLFSIGDRFLLSSLMSNSAVGLYSAAYTFGALIDILSNAVGLAWAPYFFEKKAKSDKKTDAQIRKITLLLAGMYILAAIFIGFVGPWLARYILGKDFHGATPMIPFISVGLAFRAINGLLSYFILHAEKNTLLTVNFFVSTVLHLLITYFFIKYKGLFGAGYSVLISGVVSSIIMFVFVIFATKKVKVEQ